MPMPMLAICRIDGRRRPRRDDDDVDDQHESGSFAPSDLGFPSAPGFSAIHQPTGDQPVGAGCGTWYDEAVTHGAARCTRAGMN